jgi:hypothetical protein
MDKSGSMRNSFHAVQKGALEIGKNVYENDQFEFFISIFFGEEAIVYEENTYSKFEKRINS